MWWPISTSKSHPGKYVEAPITLKPSFRIFWIKGEKGSSCVTLNHPTNQDDLKGSSNTRYLLLFPQQWLDSHIYPISKKYRDAEAKVVSQSGPHQYECELYVSPSPPKFLK